VPRIIVLGSLFMKKLLAITILGMLFCNTSFALSSDRANYEYEVCREGW